VWPAMLMGYGSLNLPYDVPANEYLTMEAKQFSTSRRWAVWVPDYLERYDPDPLRYCLSINMPESSDSDFSWHQFWRRNNDELVATYGNLVHRVLTFVYRHFEGVVPPYKELDGDGQALLAKSQDTLEAMDRSLARCRFREALRSAMSLAQEANRYLDSKSPWKAVTQDRQGVANTFGVVLGVLACLKTVLCPFLPFSSQRLHNLLGYEGEVQGWAFEVPPPGQRLYRPQPLFTKLEEDMVAAETSRLGG
ncbi:MAG: class I tRNA ligase family protein, partial [Chloroflexi bacterium]|nr:class I tRNA ligase family protein [Chloroflexota bacterium]